MAPAGRQGSGIVQRRQVRALLDDGDQLVIDGRAVTDGLAAVDHAVATAAISLRSVRTFASSTMQVSRTSNACKWPGASQARLTLPAAELMRREELPSPIFSTSPLASSVSSGMA